MSNPANPAANKTVHLQSIGTCTGIAAGDLTPGDGTVWNFGYRYTVLAVESVSKCFVKLQLRNNKDGKVYSRRTKKTFVVGYSAAR